MGEDRLTIFDFFFGKLLPDKQNKINEILLS